MDILAIITKVAKNLEITVIRNLDGEKSTIAQFGDETVEFFGYEDPVIELVSFFHNVGKVLDLEQDYSQYEQDLRQWSLGISYAKSIGIKFPDEAIKFGVNEAERFFNIDKKLGPGVRCQYCLTPHGPVELSED